MELAILAVGCGISLYIVYHGYLEHKRIEREAKAINDEIKRLRKERLKREGNGVC